MPLSGGFVYTYVPNTTTPKTTYVDSALSVPNTNPIQLNANGQATIWGPQGLYRQVITDVFGVTIWDQLTSIGVQSPPAELTLPLTLPFTFPGAFGLVPIDALKVVTGTAWAETSQIPAGVTEGIVSTITVPSSYTQAPWPNTNFSGYCDNQNPAQNAGQGNSCVPFFSIAVANAPGTGSIWTTAYVGNGIVSNTDPTHAITGTGLNIGKDFGALFGYEPNFNVYKKTAGATPAGFVDAFKAIGASEVVPSGGANAFHVAPLGAGIPWTNGFVSDTGAAVTGIALGPVASGVTQASQGITMIATNSGGGPVSGSIQVVPNGTTANLDVFVPVAGQFQWLVNAVAIFTFDGTGEYGTNTQLATNATGPFVYINATNGLPTGVPTNTSSGRTALVNDITDHKLCWYENGGGWKCVVGS